MIFHELFLWAAISSFLIEAVLKLFSGVVELSCLYIWWSCGVFLPLYIGELWCYPAAINFEKWSCGVILPLLKLVVFNLPKLQVEQFAKVAN